MSNNPDFANGKICYIEMPALDIAASAAFYKTVFDWRVRMRHDGTSAFDDGVGQVSGTWVTERKPAADYGNGLSVYIMVDNMEHTIQLVVANGGKIVEPLGLHHPEITAKFSDPAGNVLGLYQHRQ